MMLISCLVRHERIYSFPLVKSCLYSWIQEARLCSLHVVFCFVGEQIIHCLCVDPAEVFDLLMLNLSTFCHLKTSPAGTSGCDWDIYDGSSTALKFLATSVQNVCSVLVLLLSHLTCFVQYEQINNKRWTKQLLSHLPDPCADCGNCQGTNLIYSYIRSLGKLIN